MSTVYILVFLASIHLVHGQCTIHISNDLKSPEPVFFRENKLWSPNGPHLVWKAGEMTTITCQNGKLNGFGKSAATVKCESVKTFSINGKRVQPSELTCSTRVAAAVNVTTVRCADGSGQLRNIGFHDVNGRFVTYVQSCYDTRLASVIYTRHIIPGRAINSRITEPYRPSFKVAGVPKGIDPSTLYSQETQKKRLASVLKSTAIANRHISQKSYLARGHLAPDADGIFRSWQWATYYYVNVAPQWQVVNAGNWLIVESAVRNKAHLLQHDVVIFTGVHDVMTLNIAKKQPVELSLGEGTIQVPKWFWKIIKSPARKAGIAFITNNDPFRKAMPRNELLCKDICKESGWGNDNFAKFAKGYTYCCTISDLKKVVRTIPQEAVATTVLKY